MNEIFNPFGVLIMAAAIAAAFAPIQEALDEQGMALYLPSFGEHPDDGSDQYWAAVGAPPAATAPAAPLPSAPPPSATAPLPMPPSATAPPVSGLGKLPPPPPNPHQSPPPIAQGGPQGGPAAAYAASPPAPAAASPSPTTDAWHISRANLDRLLQASGGMTADGCLKTPVIVEGMAGYSRVEAVPDWQPGALLVFAVEPTQGAIECVEFAFDRSSPQW